MSSTSTRPATAAVVSTLLWYQLTCEYTLGLTYAQRDKRSWPIVALPARVNWIRRAWLNSNPV